TTELLRALAAVASNDVSYCNLAAQLALKTGRLRQAEEFFDHAARLQPSNQLHRLNLAILRLGSTNNATVQAARDGLSDLSTEPALAISSLRSLVAESLVRADLAAALIYSRQLQARPQIQFSDRLNHLEILSRINSDEFESFLEAVQPLSRTNVAYA